MVYLLQKVSEKYSLPSIYDLLAMEMNKRDLGTEFKKCVNNYWIQEIQNATREKTTLRFFKISTLLKKGNFTTLIPSQLKIKRLEWIQWKLMCGVYPLQTSKAELPKYSVNLYPL